MIALDGKSYFTSAKEVFTLILKNAARAVVIDELIDYILFFSILCDREL